MTMADIQKAENDLEGFPRDQDHLDAKGSLELDADEGGDAELAVKQLGKEGVDQGARDEAEARHQHPAVDGLVLVNHNIAYELIADFDSDIQWAVHKADKSFQPEGRPQQHVAQADIVVEAFAAPQMLHQELV